ncbi:MAG: Gfo/Idh/MocA family oxidoreductase [Rhodospirillales bacterium]|nr:Gfo/Idh/MocA family oxidoreductase [Rhodospirillales bacterium]
MKNFALIGAAGYIAPRHMRAIKDTGNELVAALDPNDSVGIIDSYFPKADFFIEFERFDRHVDKLRREKKPIDYVAICSPNYLHDAHMRFALRTRAHAICEKPLVLNPWNLEALETFESEFDRRIHTVLQLRLHPAIQDLRKRVAAEPNRRHTVDLTYITSRGHWYQTSWKGDDQKSGGIATNIGIHFFDMLAWVFGPARRNVVHLRDATTAAGLLELRQADVRWFLSILTDHLPADVRAAGKRTYRALTLGDGELEFSEGFTDLHTRSYEEILADRGFGLRDARPGIEMVHEIRTVGLTALQGDFHPFCRHPDLKAAGGKR